MILNTVLPQSPKSWEHATPSFLALNESPRLQVMKLCILNQFLRNDLTSRFLLYCISSSWRRKHINLSRKLLICQTIFFSAFPFFNIFFTSFCFCFCFEVLKPRLPASVSLERVLLLLALIVQSWQESDKWTHVVRLSNVFIIWRVPCALPFFFLWCWGSNPQHCTH